ncbi:MAG: putative two-component response regulator, partial [Gammaproteobacteria bacterium]
MLDAQKILVVDDDADVVDMVCDFLAQQGFAVAAARDAAEARKHMVEQPAQLVLIDRRMPGEDGLSLARYIREHHAAGIIMLTAADAVLDRIVGLEVGADDYV